nr:MAG TPA: hypothetical protein [Caudoviricetes sp.]
MIYSVYMEQIIDTIKKIEQARTALREAFAFNESVTYPKLNDLALIPQIYELFEKMKGGKIKVNDRKEFIFVVIYLYAPNKFFGGKMPQGLRRAITKATKVSCASVISVTCTELLVLYTTYQDFRHNVDELLKKTMNALKL